MHETVQQLIYEVTAREAQKQETAVTLRAEIEAASKRIASGPGWTPEQEVRVKHKKRSALK